MIVGLMSQKGRNSTFIRAEAGGAVLWWNPGNTFFEIIESFLVHLSLQKVTNGEDKTIYPTFFFEVSIGKV
jgi:hypothetical protein